MQLAPIDFLDEPIEALGPRGEANSAAIPDAVDTSMTFARAITLLDTIPGVNQRGGELLVAEWGIDMGRLGTAARLAAWSGVAPGNDESAGKQRSGKTRPGNQAVRTGLTQLAHAAARTKGTYLAAFYHRLAARRGKKRATIASPRPRWWQWRGASGSSLPSRSWLTSSIQLLPFDAYRAAATAPAHDVICQTRAPSAVPPPSTPHRPRTWRARRDACPPQSATDSLGRRIVRAGVDRP
jgi:hypothetical protein